MIEVIYTPTWFHGHDIVIDIVSALVLFLIAFFSIKYYKINTKNKNYLFLASSYFLIGLSFLSKILTNFTLYYEVEETRHLGFVTLTYETLHSTNTLFFLGFLFYRILTLLGLYVLYSIYVKQPTSNIFIIFYLILVLTYFSQSAYYIFYITSLLLLIFITHSYIKNSKKTRHYTAKLLAISFAIITASQLAFVFVKINPILYVIGELVQLIGYILLLITFILVLRYGKKTK